MDLCSRRPGPDCKELSRKVSFQASDHHGNRGWKSSGCGGGVGLRRQGYHKDTGPNREDGQIGRGE